MPKIYDVAVIGGGASGMAAAVSIKMHDRSLSVCVLEQLPRVGKKLITTGNGRCNITNRKISLDRYHGKDVSFADYALQNYDNFTAEVFFNQLGIVFTYDEQGRAYPYSLQASSVVDALRFSLGDMGVEVLTGCTVTGFKKQNGIFEITAAHTLILSKTLIIATGLYSGGSVLGSTGSIIGLMKSAGYKTVKMTPAIVQLKTVPDVVKSLKGIKVNAAVTLFAEDKLLRRDNGEVLFCDYGLSGPPIMQVSREAERTDAKKRIELDLMPEYSYENVFNMVRYRSAVLRGRKAEEFFTGMLNKRVGQAIVKLCGHKLNEDSSLFTTDDQMKMAGLIKRLSFEVLGTAGFDNSQVTAGGLDTSQFDCKTMMSRRDKGLFCIGEILDIDGDCGGFNLQWAWSSAMCAADAVCDYLEEL